MALKIEILKQIDLVLKKYEVTKSVSIFDLGDHVKSGHT